MMRGAANQDDRHLQHVFQQLDPPAHLERSLLRQHHVQHDTTRPLIHELLQSLITVGGRYHLVAARLQHARHQGAMRVAIVDDQHRAHGHTTSPATRSGPAPRSLCAWLVCCCT
jgi:hypothetical protein